MIRHRNRIGLGDSPGTDMMPAMAAAPPSAAPSTGGIDIGKLISAISSSGNAPPPPPAPQKFPSALSVYAGNLAPIQIHPYRRETSPWMLLIAGVVGLGILWRVTK